MSDKSVKTSHKKPETGSKFTRVLIFLSYVLFLLLNLTSFPAESLHAQSKEAGLDEFVACLV